MGDTSVVRRDGRILPPFVARFATFCATSCQQFCQPTETMRRVRPNVELLISRLAGMGYRFRPPGDDEAKDFDSTMGRMGFHAGQSFGGWTCSLT